MTTDPEISDSDDLSEDDLLLPPMHHLVHHYHPLFEEWSTEGEIPGEPSIHRLPDDMLLHIFQLMDPSDQLKCGMVSRRWYNISRASLSTLRYLETCSMFSIFKLAKPCTPDNIAQVIQCAQTSLRHVDLSTSIVNLEVFSVLGLCNQLTVLNLSRVKFSKRFATSFSVNSPPKLKTLILDSSTGLNEKCLKKMLSSVPLLEDLQLAYIPGITGKCISNNLRKNRISHLRVQFCRRFASRTLVHILQTFCDTLEQLEISSYAICKIAQKTLPLLPTLKRLTIRKEVEWRTHTDPELVKRLFGSMPNLEYLNIGEIQYCVDQYISTIVRCCPNLLYLDVSHPSSSRSANNIHEVAQLQKLRTFKADGGSFNCSFDWLTKCTSLVELSLISSDICDSEVAAAIISLEHLETLNIVNSYEVTGSFLEELGGLKRESPPLTIHCLDMNNFKPEQVPSFITLREQEILWPDDDDDIDYGVDYDEYDDFNDFDDYGYGDYMDAGYYHGRDDDMPYVFDNMYLDEMNAEDDGEGDGEEGGGDNNGYDANELCNRMSVLKAVKLYINQMVENAGKGMKIFLLGKFLSGQHLE
eukprot:sb/3463322/